ncbi:MAG TPA: SDR family NAD(P)-dependent oxidoreductase, partial [Anaeromyxobacter sp.]
MEIGFAAGLAVGAWLLARRLARLDLARKVALVTGGSRGLGFVLARELGRRGMRVVVCARDEAELDRARDTLAAEGLEVVALPCDVTDEDGFAGLVADVEENVGPIELLVNNAGIIQVGPAET